MSSSSYHTDNYDFNYHQAHSWVETRSNVMSASDGKVIRYSGSQIGRQTVDICYYWITDVTFEYDSAK